MKKLFNHILILQRSDRDVPAVMREAEQIAQRWQCRVHRLQDATEREVVDYCRRQEIDLVLLDRHKRSFWRLIPRRNDIRVDRLLKKLQCPVLTTYDQLFISSLKNIVLPVGAGLPMRKLLFATYLARVAGATIHLVSMEGMSEKDKQQSGESLFRAYRLLRENTNLPVECLRVPGESLADIAWRYAREIKADLILIHSGRESLLSGWFEGWFTRPLYELYSRALFNVSRIPVLTVS